MKRLIISLLTFVVMTASADEGMWLPSLLKRGTIDDMRKKGLQLTAEELYSINKACLKDAIVRFGSGCTGEIISDQGLLLTNHHCGYGQIQAHSSVANDLLTNGFAAMNKQQELPNPDLEVSILRSMDDVTERVLKGVKPGMKISLKDSIINRNIKAIIARAKKDCGSQVEVSVNSLFYGNQYFMFVYDVFRDVRLVFAPPSSIGKFGGDTDNWMWPRHTGDFSIFRIYTDKNNLPSNYSKDNIPYKPKSSFTISTKGVKQGDFTFVYGFPARTSQYVHSEDVRFILEYRDPISVALRTTRLNIMNEAQNQDVKTRIMYAAKNASVSNAWKKWQGEMLGLRRLGTVEKKQVLEADFEKWAADKPEYQGVTKRLKALYDSILPYNLANVYYTEAAMAVEVLKFAAAKDLSSDKVSAFFKNYDRKIDSLTAIEMLGAFFTNNRAFLPDGYTDVSVNELVTQLFVDSSYFENESPVMKFAEALTQKREKSITPYIDQYNEKMQNEYNIYMRGLMLMMEDYNFYPDANSTLRVAYGAVEGYEPRDAVYYKPVSTLRGVMEKDNPEIYDYDVPQKLRELYKANDFGRFGALGSVPVAFLTTTHTTGGNSGSPVLNGRGELVGINFDRVWEGTMSDLEFDPTMCRNIALDIRYVLFWVDKLGGAQYLIDEMKLN